MAEAPQAVVAAQIRGVEAQLPPKPRLIESAGASNRGGRPNGPDQDSVLSSAGFEFGEMRDQAPKEKRAEVLAQTLSRLSGVRDEKGHFVGTNAVTTEQVLQTEKKLQELISQGQIGSLDIVCDGMGGAAAGETASSIATYIVAQKIVEAAGQGQVTADTLRQAITQADRYIKAYNANHGADSGTTVVAALTDKDGKTHIASVGDSRVYKKDSQGVVTQQTDDESEVWGLLTAGAIDNPSDLLTHPKKNEIFGFLGSRDKVLKPEDITVTEVTLQEGEQLILCCDGAWEGVTQTPENKIKLKAIDAQFQTDIAAGMPRADAAKKAFGEMFRQINMAGLADGATPEQVAKHLTGSGVGEASQDNVSSVVVEKKKSQEAPKKEEPKKESENEGEQEDKKIELDNSSSTLVLELLSDGIVMGKSEAGKWVFTIDTEVVEKRAARLTTETNPPETRALGYDLLLMSLRHDLAQMEASYAQNHAVAVGERVNELKLQIDQSIAARAKSCPDIGPQTQPIVDLAKTMAHGRLEKVAEGEERQAIEKQIEKNPLGELESVMTNALANGKGDVFKQFGEALSKLGLKEESAAELKKLADEMLAARGKEITGGRKRKVIGVMAFLAFLLYLYSKKASEETEGRGGGGGGGH